MSSISFKEYSFLMNKIAYWIIKNNKKIKTRTVYADGIKYATMKKEILKNGGKSENKYGRRFMEVAIIDNPSYANFPNYVSDKNGKKYYLNTYTDMAKRVISYRKAHKSNPKTVNVQGDNKNNTTSDDKTLAKFEKLFGKVTDFDSALAKIEGRGYAYYYNSVYNTDETLNRIYKRQGVNCTDSAQLMYRVGVALGYEVQFIHVMCSSGGHVRLRLKHKLNTNNGWIYRDPACTLSDNGEGSRCNWCMSGRVIAYNPSWIFADVME